MRGHPLGEQAPHVEHARAHARELVAPAGCQFLVVEDAPDDPGPVRRRHRIDAPRDRVELTTGCRGGLGRRRQRAHKTRALAVQPEVLRARVGDQQLRQTLGEGPHAVPVVVESVTQPVVRDVDERREPALERQIADGVPLRVRQVRAARVVAAAVQQDDVVTTPLRQRRVHGVEVDRVCLEVVVRIRVDLQAGVPQQWFVVRPRGCTEPQSGARSQALDELGAQTQRSAPPRCLDGADTAVGQRRVFAAEELGGHASDERRIPRRRHVALGPLRRQQALLGGPYGGEDRRRPGTVSVDACAQINLVGVRIALICADQAEDRIRWQRTHCLQHVRSCASCGGCTACYAVAVQAPIPGRHLTVLGARFLGAAVPDDPALGLTWPRTTYGGRG